MEKLKVPTSKFLGQALTFDDGVNFTAGIDMVRTSPDHGTAYDIAGKGIASENSMRQALYGAIDIFKYRTEYVSRSTKRKLYKKVKRLMKKRMELDFAE